MVIIQPTTERRIRKPHKCYACGRISPPGHVMYHQVNKHDGFLNNIYWCDTCDSLLNEFGDWFFDDCENLYPWGCVCEMLNDGQTPEDLLTYLRNNK